MNLQTLLIPRPFAKLFCILGIVITRKYPLRRYFLGVLTHTTAWDRLWGDDENLTHVVLKLNIRTSASPWQE